METAPTSALEMRQAEFALEFLVVAFAPPLRGPSVTTMLRQSPAGSSPLRAEVETSHGYASYH